MPETAVMEVMSGAPVLIVAFGGINHGIGVGMPPFEFLRSLSAHGCDAIFVRDPRQAWYQLGIDGVGADVAGIVDWLRRRCRGYARTVAVGNSMGGYAALLLGRLAGLDVAIAFNPQTTIAAPDRALLNDRRWQPLIERVQAQSGDTRYHDVRAALANSSGSRPQSLLFFGADSCEDAAHAMRLAGDPGCHLFAVRNSRHQAVKLLRDGGILTRMFSMICDPDLSLAAALDDLRADVRLILVGERTSVCATEGRSLESPLTHR
jgi:hypothetical protein